MSFGCPVGALDRDTFTRRCPVTKIQFRLRSRVLVGKETLHSMLKDFVDVRVRESSSSHLQSVIQRSVKQVNHRVRVDVRSQKPFVDTPAKILDCHLPSWHRPAVMKSFGQFRIKLRFCKQSANKGSIFTTESLRHGPHLKADTFCKGNRWGEQGPGVDSFDECVHDDGCLVWPSPVNRHPTNSRLRSDGVDAQATESTAQHQVHRSFQDGPLKLRASWASSSWRSCPLEFGLVAHVSNSLNLKRYSKYHIQRKEDTIRIVSF